MTNHADPLRELTQPETQHDRRSPFFNPTRKLSQVLAKSIAHNSSSSTSSAQRPARSQTAWETSSGSSRSSSSPSQKKLKTTKAPSPQVVSSILDGMYAYPTNAQVTILARQPVRQVLPSSPLLNNLPSSSAAPCESDNIPARNLLMFLQLSSRGLLPKASLSIHSTRIRNSRIRTPVWSPKIGRAHV